MTAWFAHVNMTQNLCNKPRPIRAFAIISAGTNLVFARATSDDFAIALISSLFNPSSSSRSRLEAADLIACSS